MAALRITRAHSRSMWACPMNCLRPITSPKYVWKCRVVPSMGHRIWLKMWIGLISRPWRTRWRSATSSTRSAWIRFAPCGDSRAMSTPARWRHLTSLSTWAKRHFLIWTYCPIQLSEPIKNGTIWKFLKWTDSKFVKFDIFWNKKFSKFIKIEIHWKFRIFFFLFL